MRRKNKYLMNGALVGGAVLVIADIFSQWSELKKNGKNLNWENYDRWRALKLALFGAARGALIGELLYDYRIHKEKAIPFNPDPYLRNILRKENIKSDPTKLNKVLITRGEVKNWLQHEFGHQLVGPIEETGSFKKRTAIISNFDLDLTLPFGKFFYNTLEEMYNDVFKRIHSKYGEVAEVLKQKKTIGITFTMGNRQLHIDIAPGREINNYQIDKELNFYIRPEYIWQNGSTFKTNVDMQKSLTVNKPEVRKIIKLIKVYRDLNRLQLPSVIIDQLTITAFNNSNFDWGISEIANFRYTLNYIGSKLNNRSIIDIANSNNNLLDKMSSYDRSSISDQMMSDVKKMKENPRHLMELFEA